MNIKIIISTILVSVLTLFFAGCSVEESSNLDLITNFEECSQAGGVVKELFPAECEINGQVFIQEVNLNQSSIDEDIEEIFEDLELDDEDVEIGTLI